MLDLIQLILVVVVIIFLRKEVVRFWDRKEQSSFRKKLKTILAEENLKKDYIVSILGKPNGVENTEHYQNLFWHKLNYKLCLSFDTEGNFVRLEHEHFS